MSVIARLVLLSLFRGTEEGRIVLLVLVFPLQQLDPVYALGLS